MKFRSTLFAELRGSMGGTTASRNKGGNYLRARATPTNPNSAAQQETRQAFSQAVQEWNALTDAQRTSWAAYATETPVTDALGQEIRHSGRAWYVAQSSFLNRIGEDPAVNAPTTPGLLALGEPDNNFSLSVADGLSINFSPTGGTVAYLLAQIGPPLNAGKIAFSGPYTFLVSTPGPEFDADAVTAGRYGLPILGQRRPLRFRAVSSDGKMSNIFETFVTVVA